MKPTIKQLEAFYWTAELGSFSAASVHLRTTQSAVSKRVAELEGALSVLLFERSQKRPSLTVKGRAMLCLAEQVLDVITQISDMSVSHDPFAGRFHIGVTELSALTWLPRFLARLRDRYPYLTVEPEVGSGRTLLEKLDDNVLDLIVVSGEGGWGQSYNAAHIGTVKNAWMSSAIRFPGNRSYDVSELSRHPLLMQSPNSSETKTFERWLKANGIAASRAVRTNSLPILGRLTAAGLGVSALPIDYFEAEIGDGRLKLINIKPGAPANPYYTVFRADRDSTVPAALAKLIKESCTFFRGAE